MANEHTTHIRVRKADAERLRMLAHLTDRTQTACLTEALDVALPLERLRLTDPGAYHQVLAELHSACAAADPTARAMLAADETVARAAAREAARHGLIAADA